MTIFYRFNIGLVGAVAGLCGVAMALSPDVAAAPWMTGGYDCIQNSAGDVVGGLRLRRLGIASTHQLADLI